MFQLPDNVSIFDVTNIRMALEKREPAIEPKVDEEMPTQIYEEMIFPPPPPRTESKGELGGAASGSQGCSLPKPDDPTNVAGPNHSHPKTKKASPLPPPLPPFPKSFTLKSNVATNADNKPNTEGEGVGKHKVKVHAVSKSLEAKETVNANGKGSKSNDSLNHETAKPKKPSSPPAITTTTTKNVGKGKSSSKHSFENSAFMPFLMPQLGNSCLKCTMPEASQSSKSSTKPVEANRSKSHGQLVAKHPQQPVAAVAVAVAARGRQVVTEVELHAPPIAQLSAKARPSTCVAAPSGSAATSKTTTTSSSGGRPTNFSSSSSYSLVSSSLSNSTRASSSGGGACTSNDIMSHPRLVKLSSAELPKPSLVAHPKHSVAHYLSSL